MIYKILIFLVFIAEIVLCANIVYWLLCADKIILQFDNAVTKIKPDIKEICELSKVISWQMKELATNFVEEIKKEQEDILYNQLTKLLTGILLWKLNAKYLKKYKKLKLFKLAYKGLSVLANVV